MDVLSCTTLTPMKLSTTLMVFNYPSCYTLSKIQYTLAASSSSCWNSANTSWVKTSLSCFSIPHYVFKTYVCLQSHIPTLYAFDVLKAVSNMSQNLTKECLDAMKQEKNWHFPILKCSSEALRKECR